MNIDKMIKVEEFECDMGRQEYEDFTQSTGEYATTEVNRLHTEVFIKNEMDTSTDILLERIRDSNESPSRLIKLEKADPEMSVDEQGYTDALQLNEELNIENLTFTNAGASYLDSAMRADEQAQVDSNTGGDLFYCHHCDYATSSKFHLTFHMKFHRKKRHTYNCCYCKFQTNLRRLFSSHLKTHSTNYSQFEFVNVKEESVDPGTSDVEASNRNCIHCSAVFKDEAYLQDHIIEKHPNFISSVTRKIYHCTKCPFKTTISSKYFYTHLMQHPDISVLNRGTKCLYCGKLFENKVVLDDHIIKKHPNFASSVTRKIHECTKCDYKTTLKNFFKLHMLKHPETSACYSLRKCPHCDKAFALKISLDEHIVKNHPSFISSISRSVHECITCTYKTVKRNNMKKHMVQHPELVANRLIRRCDYCDKTFLQKRSLNDHILEEHPDFIASVSSKVYTCSECDFKTIVISAFQRHLLEHHGIAVNTKLNNCPHCDEAFERKTALDNHILKKHKDFSESVSRQIHECTHCPFKTTIRRYLDRHQLKHPETAANFSFSVCEHCGKSYKSKTMLDDHIIRKHPSFLASTTSKIHACSNCDYKTTLMHFYKLHLLKHPETACDYDYSRCPHCDKEFVRKMSLDDHIVKNHPSFISSVTCTIHKCTQCSFKTVVRHKLTKHMEQHPEIAGNRVINKCIHCDKIVEQNDHISNNHPIGSKMHQCEFKTIAIPADDKHKICQHCNARFKKQMGLDNHMLKKHPDFVASVSSKVHECSNCDFKTTVLRDFQRHQLKHSHTVVKLNFNPCMYCNASFKSVGALDRHITRWHQNVISSNK
ncbi:unnamed protein product [Callosobruchus maculatus]|uniref:C2H2-type domain-containing protein n=1 Tax=Callosobruchus maculatus TaxID=64391 RepID=A0A653BK31_CALMS|nr:unnamed protein product [Callosobruchus maculatus]